MTRPRVTRYGLAVMGDRRPSRSSICALVLVALMGFSLVAHGAAFERHLPLQDPDEEFFVEPAVRMAATGDLNPRWFGHPGSTVIYPVAGLIHVWDAVLHDGPILGSNPMLERRFASSPTPFYLIGRVWSLFFAIASIPLVFALGRRAFNRRIVGLAAATIVAVLPYVIHHGRIARTDSPATAFGLLALYLCVRAWQAPRLRWWLLSGAGVGLAVASRYFMVTLVPALLASAVVPLRRDRRRAVRASVVAVVTSAVAFLVATPYALLDFATLRGDISAEANLERDIGSGLSPAGNAWFYLTEALPDAVSWPVYLAALVGIAVIVVSTVRSRPRRPYRLMLVGTFALFIVAISASKWHWQRWTVPILPLLAVFAAVAVSTVADLVDARAPRTFRARLLVPVALVVLLALVPLSGIAETNRFDNAATTGSLARQWVQQEVPRGSAVAQTPDAFNLPPWSIAPVGQGIEIDYHLDPSRPLAEYRRAGVDYVVTTAGAAFSFMTRPKRFPDQAAFFTELTCETRLVANFARRDDRVGNGVSIYRLDRPPKKLLDVLCSQEAPNRA